VTNGRDIVVFQVETNRPKANLNRCDRYSLRPIRDVVFYFQIFFI